MILTPNMEGQQRSVTRGVPQLHLRASFEPSTVNTEKRTVSLTWTTGAAVLRGGFWSDPYYEELSLDPKHVRMERLQSGAAPLLNSHNSYDVADVLGVVETASLGKNSGTATVRFAKGPEGDDAMAKVADGILRNISVGYRTYKMQKVEGGDETIARYQAVDWEPYEISLVPIGADAGAVTRSAEGLTPCVFIQERHMQDPVNPSPTPAPAVVPTTTAPAPATTDEVRAEERKLERERITGIQHSGATLKRSAKEISDAIDKGLTLDAFNRAAINALADAPPEDGGPLSFNKRDVRIQPGADERDKFLQRSENWLIHRSGAAPMVLAAAQKRGEKIDLDPGDSRGFTLVEMARDCLERAGVRTRGMDVMQMIGLSFTHRGGGMNSSSDFPVLLENTLHKTLLAAYATTPDTWRNWCVTGSVTDFRAHNRYRQGSLGIYDDLPEGAEYKQATIPDGEKQSISAGTKGRLIAITRQTIINDDMGALNNLASGLGRAGALTIEVLAYSTLLSNPVMSDGIALFHASHGNIGAPAAISVASVDADRVLMKQQQDPSKNEYLELSPAVLLVPAGLGGQARVINNAQYDVDKIANARNQEPNKVVGLYRNVVDTARLTGTTRYSFADPAIAPVMEVAFLNGQENPYLEMQQEWRVDGTSYKARLDVGAAPRDWRGVVRNAGA